MLVGNAFPNALRSLGAALSNLTVYKFLSS